MCMSVGIADLHAGGLVIDNRQIFVELHAGLLLTMSSAYGYKLLCQQSYNYCPVMIVRKISFPNCPGLIPDQHTRTSFI